MKLPRWSPMLASPWRRPFSDPDWLFEVKWDGVRVHLCWDGETVQAWTRSGRDLLPGFPELESFRNPSSIIVDAEIIAFDDGGVPSFEILQQRLGASGLRARELATAIPVSVVGFDVLFDGNPILEEPLEARRGRLESIEWNPFVISEATPGDGEELFAAATAAGLEGVVAKRIGSSYRPGVRSADWRKIPVVNRLRAIVAGFQTGEGARSETFGSLLLGLRDGEKLRYIGRVGSGFDGRSLVAIRTALDEIASDESPFEETPDVATARWVAPGIVARVAFKNWTAAGRLRAPVFEGIDLTEADDVTWEAEGPG